MTPGEVQTYLQSLKEAGELPVQLTGNTMTEVSKSLARYLNGIASDHITALSDEVKRIAESALNTETEVRPGGASAEVGESTATARESFGNAIASLTDGPVPPGLNLDFFLRIPQEVANGAGHLLAQNSDDTRVDEFPALEFHRVYDRDIPRGSEHDPAGPENAWDDDDGRWPAACEEADDDDALEVFKSTGRCVALKSSGVWEALGDGAGGYDDTLGGAFPPFAFNSGWDVDEVSRDEAEELGLLDPGEKAEPAEFDLGALFGLKARRASFRGLSITLTPPMRSSPHCSVKDRPSSALSGSQEGHPFYGNQYTDAGYTGGVEPFKFTGIHGHSVTSAIRRLAKEGFTHEQIRNVMTSYGIPVDKATIRIQSNHGLRGSGGEPAPFTDEHLKELRERAGGTIAPPVAPPPVAPPKPPPDKLVLTKKDLIGVKEVTPEQAHATMESKLAFRGPVTGSDKASFKAAMQKGIKVYHPQALRRLCKNVNAVRFAAHGPEYNKLYGPIGDPDRSAAFYNRYKKLVVSSNLSADTMAHEYAHAIDRDQAHAQYRFSTTPRWDEAWRKDKTLNDGGTYHQYDPGKLWSYGFANHQEGFAVTCEHVHNHGLAAAEKAAPHMTALLKKWKIVHENQ